MAPDAGGSIVTLAAGTFAANVHRIEIPAGGTTYEVQKQSVDFAGTSCRLEDTNVTAGPGQTYAAFHNGLETCLLVRNGLTAALSSSKSRLVNIGYRRCDQGIHAAPEPFEFSDGTVSITAGVVTLLGGPTWPDSGISGGGVNGLGSSGLRYRWAGRYQVDAITVGANTYTIASRDNDTTLTLEDSTVTGIVSQPHSTTYREEKNADNVSCEGAEFHACDYGFLSDVVQTLSWHWRDSRIYVGRCKIGWYVAAGGGMSWRNLDIVKSNFTMLKLNANGDGIGGNNGLFVIESLQGDTAATGVTWVHTENTGGNCRVILRDWLLQSGATGGKILIDRELETWGDTLTCENCAGPMEITVLGGGGKPTQVNLRGGNWTIDNIDIASSYYFRARQRDVGFPDNWHPDRELRKGAIATTFWDSLIPATSGRTYFRTSTLTLTDQHCGMTIVLDNAGAAIPITLPAPRQGYVVELQVGAPPTTASHTIVAPGPANIMHGGIACSESGAAPFAAAANTITLVVNQAQRGDWVRLRGDGTNWLVSGWSRLLAGVTFT